MSCLNTLVDEDNEEFVQWIIFFIGKLKIHTVNKVKRSNCLNRLKESDFCSLPKSNICINSNIKGLQLIII